VSMMAFACASIFQNHFFRALLVFFFFISFKDFFCFWVLVQIDEKKAAGEKV